MNKGHVAQSQCPLSYSYPLPASESASHADIRGYAPFTDFSSGPRALEKKKKFPPHATAAAKAITSRFIFGSAAHAFCSRAKDNSTSAHAHCDIYSCVYNIYIYVYSKSARANKCKMRRAEEGIFIEVLSFRCTGRRRLFLEVTVALVVCRGVIWTCVSERVNLICAVKILLGGIEF